MLRSRGAGARVLAVFLHLIKYLASPTGGKRRSHLRPVNRRLIPKVGEQVSRSSSPSFRVEAAIWLLSTLERFRVESMQARATHGICNYLAQSKPEVLSPAGNAMNLSAHLSLQWRKQILMQPLSSCLRGGAAHFGNLRTG